MLLQRPPRGPERETESISRQRASSPIGALVSEGESQEPSIPAAATPPMYNQGWKNHDWVLSILLFLFHVRECALENLENPFHIFFWKRNQKWRFEVWWSPLWDVILHRFIKLHIYTLNVYKILCFWCETSINQYLILLFFWVHVLLFRSNILRFISSVNSCYLFDFHWKCHFPDDIYIRILFYRITNFSFVLPNIRIRSYKVNREYSHSSLKMCSQLSNSHLVVCGLSKIRTTSFHLIEVCSYRILQIT